MKNILLMRKTATQQNIKASQEREVRGKTRNKSKNYVNNHIPYTNLFHNALYKSI